MMEILITMLVMMAMVIVLQWIYLYTYGKFHEALSYIQFLLKEHKEETAIQLDDLITRWEALKKDKETRGEKD